MNQTHHFSGHGNPCYIYLKDHLQYEVFIYMYVLILELFYEKKVSTAMVNSNGPLR
jgi:hypothetical protein